jgi:hypothetical protein
VTRIFLIIIMMTQLGCASFFWQTLGGTVIGNIGAEIIKTEFNKEDDEKEKPPEN